MSPSGKLKKEKSATRSRRSFFTLELNGRPTLVLEATSLPAARRLTSEEWFLIEMGSMRSGGAALFRTCDVREVRPARPDEAVQLQLGRMRDVVSGEDTKYAFAFLVQIDPRQN
jgi:hypothetical protein